MLPVQVAVIIWLVGSQRSTDNNKVTNFSFQVSYITVKTTSPGFISHGNQIALGRLARACILMKQRMEDLRIDYMDPSHGFFTEGSKIKVDFSLPERLIQVCIWTFRIIAKLDSPWTQAVYFLIKVMSLRCDTY